MRPGPGVHRAGMLARPRAIPAVRAAALAVQPGRPRRDRPQAVLQVPVRGLTQMLACDPRLRRCLIIPVRDRRDGHARLASTTSVISGSAIRGTVAGRFAGACNRGRKAVVITGLGCAV